MGKPLLSILCVALLAGCASPGLTRVRNDLAQSIPEAEIGRGRSFGFGPITLGLARHFAGKDAAAEGVDLGAVRRLRVATYPVRGTFDPMRVGTPRAIQRLIDRGWTTAVRTRDGDGATWILYRGRGDEITDLLTASLETEELALVHISGDLDRLLRGVLREHAGDLLGGELAD